MTALGETAITAIAYQSLNSILGATGWRMEWVKNETGQEKLLYFPLTEDDFLHLTILFLYHHCFLR